MKITCQKSVFLKAINTVSKAVSTKTTMPILECILIDSSNDQIKLTANDMELGIETIMDGEIKEEGMYAVNARMLGEIIRKVPDDTVSLETTKSDQVIITSGKYKAQIEGQSGEEFSFLPNVEKEDFIEISEFSLREAIRQTIFSISDNDIKVMMTGELFEIENDILKVVSLDGHRISVRKILLKESYSPKKVIVPGKTLQEISKIINGNPDETVKIYFSKNHILFEFENTVVVSRLIEGEYYKIDKMISDDYETKVTVNKKELLEGIDRATSFIRDSDKKPIVLTISDEKMELKLRSQIGGMNDEIDIVKTGRDLVIGFNPKFLIDALRVIDDEQVDLYFMNAKSPCFIKDEKQTYIYLILPVNIGAED